MNHILLLSILVLSALGGSLALILFFVASKFKIVEDPRIDIVEEALPGANCGGCGYSGCRAFAEALVKAEQLDNLLCPVGGNDVMKKVAEILGKAVTEQKPLVAVLRCNGTFQNRSKTSIYNGTKTCAITALFYKGDTGCQYGCLGYGDCVKVCQFDALHIDEVTGLPVVDDAKCTACGACVRECPRNLFELRIKQKKDRKIYVACMNEDKGGIARKYCNVACIGCSKCFQVCPHNAITMKNNLAYIDSEKCKLCRKCVEVCPTQAIIEFGFPPRKKEEINTSNVQNIV